MVTPALRTRRTRTHDYDYQIGLQDGPTFTEVLRLQPDGRQWKVKVTHPQHMKSMLLAIQTDKHKDLWFELVVKKKPDAWLTLYLESLR